jgi:hypothetical protein
MLSHGAREDLVKTNRSIPTIARTDSQCGERTRHGTVIMKLTSEATNIAMKPTMKECLPRYWLIRSVRNRVDAGATRMAHVRA